MDHVFIGGAGADGAQALRLDRANRHGIVAGATGTGKTVTLQILAEGFSNAGVPVFAADVKGDLSGLACAGTESHKLHDKLMARAQTIGFADYAYGATPTVFWDVFGQDGHPIRATVQEMGPMLLSRLMGLNDTQEGVLTIAFALADDEGMLLLDLKDLRALLTHVGERRQEIGLRYGNVSPASIGAIQRRLLVLEREGAEAFFGEPELELRDFMRTARDGRGYVNILAADQLIQAPRLYSTFLLWLLSELFEELPEIGDPDKPELVFFFDEAHLLFDSAPQALIDKIEQVVKLVRSKGVGVFFVTQNPRDVPDAVLAQLGTRIQHALRAYTPSERKALKAAADSFRENPSFDSVEVIPDLGVGEALVSTLDAKGRPTMAARTLIRPPSSRLGPAEVAERRDIMRSSPVKGRYDEALDRESAYEQLEARRLKAQEAEAAAAEEARRDKDRAAAEKERARASRSRRSSRSRRQGYTETAVKSALRTVSTQIARAVVRGLLGGLRR